MRACVSLLLSLLLVCAPAQSSAQVAVELDGEDGVWFDLGKAGKLLHMAEEELPRLRLLVDEQDKLIELQSRQIFTATTALAKQKEITQVALQRGDDMKVLAEKSSGQSWAQSPVLWAGVGAVGTAIVMIVTFFLLRSQGIVIIEK